MNIKKNIPNLLTFLNLAFGFLAIIFSLRNAFHISAVLIICAVIFDHLDGKIARIFNAESEIGSELDSLADLVSFGVAPAVMFYSLFQNSSLLVALIVFVLAGAYRLARFNVSKKKVKGYVGMPITLNGLIFPILYFANPGVSIVSILFLISAILMISSINFKKVYLI